MSDGDYELLIYNGNNVYEPLVTEDITWETKRMGSAGSLRFSVLNDTNLDFQEGNKVTLKWMGREIFMGYVFDKERTKDQVITVLCYDQLRYFKNRDSISYSNKKASEVVTMLLEDYGLKRGKVADTGYFIGNKIESNKTLLDIIYGALDETFDNTGRLFVLYDDYGRITLSDVRDRKLDYLLDEDTACDFCYTSSISSDTYNRVKLLWKDRKGSERMKTVQSDDAVARWGVLQYFAEIYGEMNLDTYAQSILANYNRKRRTLTVKNALGDARVRAGTVIPVNLVLGDINVNSFMLVEEAVHKFSGKDYKMDLTIRGGLID